METRLRGKQCWCPGWKFHKWSAAVGCYIINSARNRNTPNSQNTTLQHKSSVHGYQYVVFLCGLVLVDLNPNDFTHIIPGCFTGKPKDPATACWDIRHVVITLRPRQNGRQFADNIFKWIFLNEKVGISIMISLKCVPKQCLRLSQKGCRSSCFESQNHKHKIENKSTKVPGPPPKLLASDWWTCGNFQHCS